MKKRLSLCIAVLTAMILLCMTSLAAGWFHDGTGWRWYNQDGSVLTSGWYWLDGNGDGIAESYCFNEAGYIYQGTLTPDHYTVNADGAWTVNGVVQTRRISTTSTIGPGASSAAQQSAEEAAASAAAAGITVQVTETQIAGIANYMADCLYVFGKKNRLFGTETVRSELSFDQICELMKYYGLYIADGRVSTGSGPVFVTKSNADAIMKEAFGKAGRPAIERLERDAMVIGDQFVFNYGRHEAGFTVVPGTLQYAIESNMLKITAGMDPANDSEEDGYMVAWFSPSGAGALYGLRLERIDLRKYR